MAEVVITRVQKEVGMLHKELELFRSEMVAVNEQLKKDMDAKWEATNMEMRKMFSQLMLKFEASQGVDLLVLEMSAPQNRNRRVYWVRLEQLAV